MCVYAIYLPPRDGERLLHRRINPSAPPFTPLKHAYIYIYTPHAHIHGNMCVCVWVCDIYIFHNVINTFRFTLVVYMYYIKVYTYLRLASVIHISYYYITYVRTSNHRRRCFLTLWRDNLSRGVYWIFHFGRAHILYTIYLIYYTYMYMCVSYIAYIISMHVYTRAPLSFLPPSPYIIHTYRYYI